MTLYETVLVTRVTLNMTLRKSLTVLVTRVMSNMTLCNSLTVLVTSDLCST